MEKRVAGIGDGLLEINPDIKFTYLGEDYDTLQILSDHEKPTKEVIESARAKAQKKIDDTYYQKQRSERYPDIREQLDLLYHDMTAGKGDKTGEWYKAVNKVKTDNPKPE